MTLAAKPNFYAHRKAISGYREFKQHSSSSSINLCIFIFNSTHLMCKNSQTS